MERWGSWEDSSSLAARRPLSGPSDYCCLGKALKEQRGQGSGRASAGECKELASVCVQRDAGGC